ncbi:AzlD family protein [Halomonas coralii]|uniref:AzlD family protein n=1 Tax=Modicisalibacter sp. R2A 31.J TaxID=2831898 RepID=UPI001CCA0D47|nr:AzlD family protein [Modicisalibacter sp. R2A 31.J]MBZ9557338.1 AzlD family protein [Modicisalibacter sp. R2A 31.J]
MIDMLTLVTIVLMACVTYLTRIAGYVVVRNMALSPRALSVLEAAPGCVLISVIAPRFVSDSVADLLALAITVLAATRFSLLPTVIIAIVSAGLLRYSIP